MARYCTFVSPKCLPLLTNCFTTNPHSTVFFTGYNDNDDECTLSHFIFINLQVITFNGNALFAKCVTDCVARPCTFHQSHLTIKLSNMFISKIWRYIAIHTSWYRLCGSFSALHSFRLDFKRNKLMGYIHSCHSWICNCSVCTYN